MKKLILLLPAIILVFASSVQAQVTLDPEQPINAQITSEETTYLAEAGNFYAFDGTLECDFEMQIIGSDGDTWIKDQENPPVIFQIPAGDGTARDMINANEGCTVELRNILFTGLMSNDINLSSIVRNFAGNSIIFDNNVFTDIIDHTTRSTGAVTELTITNNLFINLDRRGGSPFGGMPFRLDAEAEQLTFENNTLFNGAREFGNGGEFFTTNMTEIHNTLVNQQVNGHELHFFSALQANNIYYNWSWRGRNLRTNGYEAPFTTWEFHSNVATKLDSVSLYQGFNAFYLDSAISDYWENEINPQMPDDSAKVRQSFLWNESVDSTIVAHDNLPDAEDDFTIGKNYWQFDPEFAVNPSKIDSMNAWNLANWVDGEDHYADWRITPPVEYDEDTGAPTLSNWPLDLDLSYSSDVLQTAGTDGLPLGDLNWFPEAKEDYLANRDTYIAALQDSMTAATFVYTPGDSASALITSENLPVSIESNESNIPDQIELEQNYPNPFNPTTKISFKLPSASDVKLTVYNVLGQQVAELINQQMSAGIHTVSFDASNLASGTYLYRIETGSFTQNKKMMLIK